MYFYDTPRNTMWIISCKGDRHTTSAWQFQNSIRNKEIQDLKRNKIKLNLKETGIKKLKRCKIVWEKSIKKYIQYKFIYYI